MSKNPRTVQNPTTGVDEAIAMLLAQVTTGPSEEVSLEEAQGRVLAEGISAGEQHPEHDTSAMDGYAVRSADLAEATANEPVSLGIKEDIQAGFPPKRHLEQGETSRISTGALLPKGADAVVMREVVDVLEGGQVRFFEPPEKGLNVRFSGEHIKLGEEILPAGTVLDPPSLGMAAYLGADRVTCFSKVKVAVLATGSELVKAGAQVGRGQIRDSNSISLAAAVRSLGCEVTIQKCVVDTEDALDRALGEAFAESQVVLTSGGISAGWHDLVRARIESLGGEFSFHKLRMRPGKPLAFGTCGQARFFCLPGNPVSSMVTFEVFVKQALLKMLGREHKPRSFTATLEERIEKKKGFTIFYRGRLEHSNDGLPTVRLTGPQGSHMLRSLVEADVLIKTPEESEVLEPGSRVEVWPYSFV
jgi:molybdopterin molybdotransferase